MHVWVKTLLMKYFYLKIVSRDYFQATLLLSAPNGGFSDHFSWNKLKRNK